jgi:hypothetical protein
MSFNFKNLDDFITSLHQTIMSNAAISLPPPPRLFSAPGPSTIPNLPPIPAFLQGQQTVGSPTVTKPGVGVVPNPRGTSAPIPTRTQSQNGGPYGNVGNRENTGTSTSATYHGERQSVQRTNYVSGTPKGAYGTAKEV